ncbi:hypothetical protein [Candidatus Fukatsuia endosymbiont of Tuberolachnus salignus]|uniref:hypothetical protein n=1 Tax=Candidatus Fukatsuia endosymbiont of Tuberolachnus salignus TaxID=3077957 RepID=UPI00313D9CFF
MMLYVIKWCILERLNLMEVYLSSRWGGEKVISSDVVEKIKNDESVTMGIWEKIKDWFFDTHRADAYKHLRTFLHATSTTEKIHAFLSLKSLAPEGRRSFFKIEKSAELNSFDLSIETKDNADSVKQTISFSNYSESSSFNKSKFRENLFKEDSPDLLGEYITCISVEEKIKLAEEYILYSLKNDDLVKTCQVIKSLLGKECNIGVCNVLVLKSLEYEKYTVFSETMKHLVDQKQDTLFEKIMLENIEHKHGKNDEAVRSAFNWLIEGNNTFTDGEKIKIIFDVLEKCTLKAIEKGKLSLSGEFTQFFLKNKKSGAFERIMECLMQKGVSSFVDVISPLFKKCGTETLVKCLRDSTRTCFFKNDSFINGLGDKVFVDHSSECGYVFVKFFEVFVKLVNNGKENGRTPDDSTVKKMREHIKKICRLNNSVTTTEQDNLFKEFLEKFSKYEQTAAFSWEDQS